jgi:hypothetical protein
MFKYALGELQGFYKSTADGKLQRLYFPGTHKILGQAAVRFPARREMEYYIFNLAQVDRVDAEIFLTAGHTAERLVDLERVRDFKVEAGLAATVSGRSISGLIGASVTVGLAIPLQGAEEDQRRPRIFIATNLPF